MTELPSAGDTCKPSYKQSTGKEKGVGTTANQVQYSLMEPEPTLVFIGLLVLHSDFDLQMAWSMFQSGKGLQTFCEAFHEALFAREFARLRSRSFHLAFLLSKRAELGDANGSGFTVKKVV